ncbi:PREDICTED: endoplasmic reticulum metallopeptidase 1 [Nicotiana attenuata]|uniref:endoplasmic reticulum metallopeptidase 1 n=1 Tax=Nicotiana attenuata TaxID=49451 RepID=UPI000905283B|nr:PREDICTED: endoplasmic reticulum metallopeptidase 1 [Nicotiana attenuata]
MRQRSKGSAQSKPSSRTETSNSEDTVVLVAKRSKYVILALFVLVAYGTWSVYQHQFLNLPKPLGAEEVGKRGFSEHEAIKHVKALTQLGPHPVGSDALDHALQYVLQATETIKEKAHWEVDVELDLFHAKSGANLMVGGLFKGKTLVYSDLNHVVLRISPKYASEAAENAILVSSHIDTVFSAEGAGDCSSCVAVMLELARGVSQWAHGFKSAVIFLFNTGEEEGLNGAHSFITQHPWSDTVTMAIDLEAMGVGGKSGIFQAGPQPWAIENFALAAKYPSGQIVAQDVFKSGAIKSATDFQVYQEIAGLSGLDFAYADNTAVYHTKNDKLKLLKPGSLQHLGENMLAFLLKVATSAHLPKGKATDSRGKSGQDTAIYFDILGAYMVVFRQRFARMLYNSVILQSILIWTTSLFMGGYSAMVSLALSSLSLILMWICAIGFSLLVAFVLPLVSSSPIPFVSSPWLVVGLFGAPAVLGAFTGQHVGYLILVKYLTKTFSRRNVNLPFVVQDDLAKLDAERWLFKAGLMQWLVLLIMGNFYKIGSSYLALVWLASPAFAYGLLEATLSPARLPKPLKTVTLLIGLSVPFLLSSGIIIHLVATLIGSAVRLERNPGSNPEWLGNVIIAVLIAAIACLTLVYLLSYIHISGAKVPLITVTCFLFGISLTMVRLGVVPPFTEDTARAVNVVHVVDMRGANDKKQEPVSRISLFSTTPGNLIKEVEQIGEGFVCGTDEPLDFVTFSVKYGCWSDKNANIGWHELDIPLIHVENDTKGDNRVTHVSIDTKVSTRWTLGINTDEIEDFQLKGGPEELVPIGDKSNADGWHIIQFSGGKKAPRKFSLMLFWANNHTRKSQKKDSNTEQPLLKLRTDVDRITSPTETVLKKLPQWCSLFGKSTSPLTLAFLSSLSIDF